MNEKEPHNPFDPAADPDRHRIWEMLIRADSEAFIAGDWSRIEHDFDAGQFEGIQCGHSLDPVDWRVTLPDLASYRDQWLAASRMFLQRRFARLSHREAIYARTRLANIHINHNRALCRKTFSGDISLEDGTMLSERRQTLYRLHRGADGRWRIVGFIGQLPLEVK
jgi:hypothetical protein